MIQTRKKVSALLFALLFASALAGMGLSHTSAWADEQPEGVAKEAAATVAASGSEIAAADVAEGIPADPLAENADASADDPDAPAAPADGALGEQVVATIANPADSTSEGDLAPVDADALHEGEDPIATQDDPPAITVDLDVHVENLGWTGNISLATDGSETMVGTTGSSLRLEALIFTLSGITGTIECQTHVQNVGWQDAVDAGSLSGTEGQSLRIEALKLALTGELSQWYDLAYQAHVQNIGWMGWVGDGEIAGTSGQSLRLEALNIKITPKATKSATPGDGIVGIRASSHVENIGWQNEVASGETTGTTGQSLRVEAIRLKLDTGALSGGVDVNAHVQNIGWQGYRPNTAGTEGQSLRMEAIELKLTGSIASDYDIVYRAHVQNIGWQPWTVNGGIAGTSGQSLRVEALQIKLVKKGSSQYVGDGAVFIALADDIEEAMRSTGEAGAQATVAGFDIQSNDDRYYLRNESGGITLQSVATGMFLEESGAKVVQQAYDETNDAQVWLLAWDGGFAITNKATGNTVMLSGNKVVTGTDGRWTITNTCLINDGNYVVANSAAGMVLDVNGASWANGANIMVHEANGGGNQVFTFVNTGGDVYRVTNTMTGKAVDVVNGDPTSGTNVQQWPQNGTAAQYWKATVSRKGGIVFTNSGSGNVLTAGGLGGNNENVTSSTDVDAKTQRWSLTISAYQGDPVVQRAMSIVGGMGSSTGWLIAVDLSNTQLVILNGSAGNWTVTDTWRISCGADGSPTITGDYYVGSKGYSFGDSDHTCYYYTQIMGDYLFHSVLYYPGTMTVKDGRLGYHISMGCVRMDINNAKWIYDNIPGGTHIFIYN